MKYVCGFLFDSTLQNVALILKDRGPNGMAGHLNGLGGKIEFGESPRRAMVRETQQESGVVTDISDWSCYHTERYEKGDMVYFMAAKSLDAHLATTKETEMVRMYGAVPEIFSLHHSRQGSHEELILPEYLRGEVAPPMYNLEYLIPMALCWLARPLDRYMES